MPKIPIDAQKKVSPEFRERIIELMDEHELNKSDFAKLINISLETTSRITIYGIIPSLKTLLKIADYFNLSLPYLLAESQENDFEKATAPADFQSRLKGL